MKFLKIVFLFISITAFSQSKVGAVDVDYILAQMPGLETVQTNIEAYAQQLDLDLNKKIDEYKVLAEAYRTGEAGFTQAEKTEKQNAIVALEADIQKFQQNGATLINIKKEEYLRPLYTKIGEALDKVAKAQNFTQVHVADANIVYLDPAYDLTLSIIQELGITLKEE